MQSIYINEYHLRMLSKEELKSVQKGQFFYYSGYLFVVEHYLNNIEKMYARQVEENTQTFFLLENRVFTFFLNYDVESIDSTKEYFYYVKRIDEQPESADSHRFEVLMQS